MKRGASEFSDATSLATTTASSPPPPPPPRTPKTPSNKRPAYYVQSPSTNDDGGGDKSSSSSTTAHTTPAYRSPLESPSHPSSTGRRSISMVSSSAATRFSGTLLRSFSPAATSRSRPAGAWRKRHGGGGSGSGKKRRRDACGISITEEEEAMAGDFDVEVDPEQEQEIPTACAAASWLAAVLLVVFAAVCLVVWGAARRYKPRVVVKSLTVHSFYAGEGTDDTGVPTKLVTVNCSLAMAVHNPSTMFGIHVSSTSIRLLYSEIAIATGHLERFYQPRKSRGAAAVVLHGEKTPLYGAGAGAGAGAGGRGKVPLTLEMAVRTRGHVIGRLVRVTHAERVRCAVAVDPGSSTPVRFRRNDCSYSYRHR